jgi:hypothetical protein
VTKLIGRLQFQPNGVDRWRLGYLHVYRHRLGKWVATAPGCSATGATPTGALERLRARVLVAAAALGGK